MKASNNVFPSLLLVEGSAPASPPASDFRLFFDSADHLLKWKNSAGTVVTIATGSGLSDQGVITYLDGTVAAAPGTPASGKLRIYAKTGNVLAVKDDTGAETVLGAGGGSVVDPIFDMFGTPDTAFEFATSSLTGLTAMGTVQADDANTTVPGCYYLRNNSNASPFFRGRSLSASPPFTAITFLSTNPSRNYEGAALLYGESTVMTSGKFDVVQLGVGTADYQVGGFAWTGPGTFSATIATKAIATYRPMFLGIKVVSSTDVSAYYSFDGRLWFAIYESRNPGFTIAMLAMASAAQNTTGFAAAYEFLRIWNSAKTFRL